MGTPLGLVAFIPEADPVVHRWREQLDISAQCGLGAHVTLLYPFGHREPIADDEIDRRVHSALGDIEVVELHLDTVSWFDDVVVWVDPASTQLDELSSGLQAAFPEYPRYGGIHDEVVLHMTVGASPDTALLREAAADVAGRLPIDATVTEIALVRRDAPGDWVVDRTFALGAHAT